MMGTGFVSESLGRKMWVARRTPSRMGIITISSMMAISRRAS
jgi:hypothetical protein